MTRLSTAQFRRTIEDYFDEREMDLVCRKNRRGYSLYDAETDDPVARLCPTGESDVVEVKWWNGDRWQPVTEFGLALPLAEALDYVSEDPEDIFFETDDDDAVDVGPSVAGRYARNPFIPLAVQLHVGVILPAAFVGAACGGLAAGAAWGLLCGSIGATAVCLLFIVARLRFQLALFTLVFCGLPAAVVAGVAGAAGASLCDALGGGIWPSVAGALTAIVYLHLLTLGGWPARVVGFAAGVNLGIVLADSLDLRQQFLGAVMIGLSTALTIAVSRTVGDVIDTAMRNRHSFRDGGDAISWLHKG
jgi:hypothetical protein